MRGFLVGKPSRAYQQQRLAAFGGEGEQRAVQVAKVDRPFLPGGCGQDPLGHALVILAAEAVPAHVGEVGVAQDHKGPGAHRGARFEPLLRRPGLEQRFLYEIIGDIGPAAQPAGKGAQVWNYLGQVTLEVGFLRGRARGIGPATIAH